MAKRVDFAAKRRSQGRAATARINELVELMTPLAQQNGLDLKAHLKETAARDAETRRQLIDRLRQSVLPLFIDDERGRPERIGSCVLVCLDSFHYVFTAAHVIRDAGASTLWVPAAEGSRTRLILPRSAAGMTPEGNPLDIGLFLLPPRFVNVFERRVFLYSQAIDQGDIRDDRSLISYYFVLGYPASRTQVKISHERSEIRQKLFHLRTAPVEAAEYIQQGLPQPDYILLDFDHKEILIGGKPISLPLLQGVSGGGIFHVSELSTQSTLTAIATQNRRQPRLIVGTRLKHFLDAAREMKAAAPPEYFGLGGLD
jgi:hypothetical protein